MLMRILIALAIPRILAAIQDGPGPGGFLDLIRPPGGSDEPLDDVPVEVPPDDVAVEAEDAQGGYADDVPVGGGANLGAGRWGEPDLSDVRPTSCTAEQATDIDRQIMDLARRCRFDYRTGGPLPGSGRAWDAILESQRLMSVVNLYHYGWAWKHDDVNHATAERACQHLRQLLAEMRQLARRCDRQAATARGRVSRRKAWNAGEYGEGYAHGGVAPAGHSAYGPRR